VYYANLKHHNRFGSTHAGPFFDWSTVTSPIRTINTRQKSAQMEMEIRNDETYAPTLQIFFHKKNPKASEKNFFLPAHSGENESL
jgi:hypothetical protein